MELGRVLQELLGPVKRGRRPRAAKYGSRLVGATDPRFPPPWNAASMVGNAGELLNETEPLRLDAERHVELRAEVLERDGRRELDDLRLGEARAHPREQLLGNLAVREGDRLRVLERRLLALVEEVAGEGRADLGDLRLRRTCSHPPGCVDVDSERAPVDQGDAQVDQRQELRGEEA